MTQFESQREFLLEIALSTFTKMQRNKFIFIAKNEQRVIFFAFSDGM